MVLTLPLTLSQAAPSLPPFLETLPIEHQLYRSQSPLAPWQDLQSDLLHLHVFFHYACPGCQKYDGDLLSFSQQLPRVIIHRALISTHPSWEPMARFAQVLAQWGCAKAMHAPMMAYARRHGPSLHHLSHDVGVQEALQAQGLTVADIRKAMDDPQIEASLQRARQQAKACHLVFLPHYVFQYHGLFWTIDMLAFVRAQAHDPTLTLSKVLQDAAEAILQQA